MNIENKSSLAKVRRSERGSGSDTWRIDLAAIRLTSYEFKPDCARSVEIRNYPQHIRVQVFQPDPRTGECVFFERRK